MAYIMKGTDPFDFNVCFTRTPARIRPLTLSITDAKLISKCTKIPLSSIAEKTISSAQLGGLLGRLMTEHIVAMEGKILDFIARQPELSGIIALDIASAFPPLSRDYLFWILRTMKIPSCL